MRNLTIITVILGLMSLAGCLGGSFIAKADTVQVGHTQVMVHLDDNQQQVQGELLSNNETGVEIRLSNSKWYFYPQHRVSGVEEL